ncbi:MAG TPA: M67 family metallopeptidase [Tepidisphaeraceae bacterium]
MNELVLPAELYTQIEAEGAAAYPNECCGILYGRHVRDGGVMRRMVERIEPVRNEFEAGEQYHRFLITPDTLMKAEKTAAEEGRLVLGFYHSHPDHPARPSQYDLDHAWPFYSYVIVSIIQRQADVMTCWVLDEQTNQFKQQEIIGTTMNDE